MEEHQHQHSIVSEHVRGLVVTTVPTKGGYAFSWSVDDDLRLTEIMMKQYNLNPLLLRHWEPIAKEHGRGKSATECQERWSRYLERVRNRAQVSQPWTEDEDTIVLHTVTNSLEQPFTQWKKLAQQLLPGRVGKKVRDRWINHLNPAINPLPFSRDEDLLLWAGHQKYGHKWVDISKQFRTVRPENHVKNRWHSAAFQKFIAHEFGPEAYSDQQHSSFVVQAFEKVTASVETETDTVSQQQHTIKRMNIANVSMVSQSSVTNNNNNNNNNTTGTTKGNVRTNRNMNRNMNMNDRTKSEDSKQQQQQQQHHHKRNMNYTVMDGMHRSSLSKQLRQQQPPTQVQVQQQRMNNNNTLVNPMYHHHDHESAAQIVRHHNNNQQQQAQAQVQAQVQVQTQAQVQAQAHTVAVRQPQVIRDATMMTSSPPTQVGVGIGENELVGGGSDQCGRFTQRQQQQQQQQQHLLYSQQQKLLQQLQQQHQQQQPNQQQQQQQHNGTLLNNGSYHEQPQQQQSQLQSQDGAVMQTQTQHQPNQYQNQYQNHHHQQQQQEQFQHQVQYQLQLRIQLHQQQQLQLEQLQLQHHQYQLQLQQQQQQQQQEEECEKNRRISGVPKNHQQLPPPPSLPTATTTATTTTAATTDLKISKSVQSFESVLSTFINNNNNNNKNLAATTNTTTVQSFESVLSSFINNNQNNNNNQNLAAAATTIMTMMIERKKKRKKMEAEAQNSRTIIDLTTPTSSPSSSSSSSSSSPFKKKKTAICDSTNIDKKEISSTSLAVPLSMKGNHCCDTKEIVLSRLLVSLQSLTSSSLPSTLLSSSLPSYRIMNMKLPPIPSEVWATVVKRASTSTLSSSSWLPAPAPAVATNTRMTGWSIDPKTKSILVPLDHEEASPTTLEAMMGDSDSIFDDTPTSMSLLESSSSFVLSKHYAQQQQHAQQQYELSPRATTTTTTALSSSSDSVIDGSSNYNASTMISGGNEWKCHGENCHGKCCKKNQHQIIIDSDIYFV